MNPTKPKQDSDQKLTTAESDPVSNFLETVVRWFVIIGLVSVTALVIFTRVSVSDIFRWLNNNEGAISAILTLVLVISTIITTWLTRRAVEISSSQIDIAHQQISLAHEEIETMRAQFNYEQSPSLRFSGSKDPSLWRLYNMGKYPLYLKDICFAYNSALYYVAQEDFYSSSQTLKIAPFEDIQLPIKNALDFKNGPHDLLISFYYGGTGNAVHTLKVAFRSNAGLRFLIFEDQALLTNYDPEDQYETKNSNY
jgi:hypothetical protein